MTLNLPDISMRAEIGEPITRAEALEILQAPDLHTLDIVNAASKARFAFFGNRVKVNYLVNLKSGLCPEDCFYCSQRLGSQSEILKYSWINPQKALEAAEAGIEAGAQRVCLVASGTGPSHREVDKIADITRTIKDKHPDVEICACAGFLKEGQGEKLADAGVHAYNHNVNAAESFYEDICTTHKYGDRVDTVDRAKKAKLSPCSGFIAGMGETDEHLVELAFALQELQVDSIPVNFLLPFDGTPLQGTTQIEPLKCLRILAMIRLVNPTTEVRIAAGREIHLKSMQTLGLYVANSIFLGDYLTSEGQAGKADLDMIASAGLVVEGQENSPTQQTQDPVQATKQPMALRKRGVGTVLPANS